MSRKKGTCHRDLNCLVSPTYVVDPSWRHVGMLPSLARCPGPYTVYFGGVMRVRSAFATRSAASGGRWARALAAVACGLGEIHRRVSMDGGDDAS